MTAHKSTFWTVIGVSNSSGVYTAANRQKMSNATSTVQSDNPDVLFASFAGGIDAKEAPEVMLTLPFDTQSAFETAVKDLEASIKIALTDAFADTTDSSTVSVSHQDAVRYQVFDSDQLVTLQAVRAAFSLEKAHTTQKAAAELKLTFPSPSVLPSHFHRLTLSSGVNAQMTAEITATDAATISQAQIAEGFSLSAAWYNILKKSSGDEIQKSIEGIQKTFDAISKETKTNVAALLMVAGGLVTIGKGMWSAYSALTAAAELELAALVPELLALAGGIAVVGAVVAVVVALVVVGILWALVKNAVNLMVVVNGQESTVTLTQDYLLYGDRREVVTDLPAAPKADKNKPMAYPAGFFTYQKFEVAGIPLSFYGSTVGIAYSVGSDAFSIGLDCPNTILGGTNSVAVLSGEKASDVATRANSGHNATETVKSINSGSVQATRASGYGSVNYIVGMVLPA